MHGFSRRVEEETDRITSDRRTEEIGSLARGDPVASLEGTAACCCNRVLVGVDAAAEDLGLLVRLTYLADEYVVGTPESTRMGRRAAFMIDDDKQVA